MQKIAIRSIEKLDFRTKEAYKTLRTNLTFAGKNVKVVALTSCTPNEGKTSLSFQLAMSLAEGGWKTVMVDADLRKSVLRGRYKASHEKFGLSHYLSGQSDLEDTLCETNIENFHIIFAGPVPPNPSELLGSDNFKEMVKQLREEYDYVIIDTPPLGSVIDGAVVAACCDGTVIVIESNAVSYRFVQSVKDQLEKAEVRILGCVLNKVNLSSKSYYGKYYEKYYGSYYGKYYANDGDEEKLEPVAPVKRADKEKVNVEKQAAQDKEETVDDLDVVVEEEK